MINKIFILCLQIISIFFLISCSANANLIDIDSSKKKPITSAKKIEESQALISDNSIKNSTEELSANVKLSGIWGDNMVIQRNKANIVWGTGEPNKDVLIEFANKTYKTTVSLDGSWKISLNELSAGGPYDMVIKGKNIRTIKSILIGDVWFCGGQSNMEYTINKFPYASEEIKIANYPNIRLFTAAPQISLTNKDIKGIWQAAQGENIKNFSATAYFFGRYVHNQLNIPIGLISSSYSGSSIEAWIDKDSLIKDQDFSENINKLYNSLAPEGMQNLTKLTPTGLYNGMVASIIPFSIKGIIWYQGEANVERAEQYKRLFPLLINNWRKKWALGDFPFLFVQLANYLKEKPEPGQSKWAELREAQTKALSLPNTALVTAIDIGDANNIHPQNKQEVGRRLGISAMKTAYGQNINSSGPIYKSISYADNKIIISFDNTGKGLMAIDNSPMLKGFAISDSHKKFYWANAYIEGNSVIVSANNIINPVAVRYAWADNPGFLNLYNKDGFPAIPFRTDNW